MENAILYSVLYLHQKISVESSFLSSFFHNYLFRISHQLLYLLPVSVPPLSAGIFVFFACYAYLLAFLAIGDVSCSLAAFVFIACYISCSMFVGVGFSLIGLSAVVHFMVGLLMLTFLQFVCWPHQLWVVCLIFWRLFTFFNVSSYLNNFKYFLNNENFYPTLEVLLMPTRTLGNWSTCSGPS